MHDSLHSVLKILHKILPKLLSVININSHTSSADAGLLPRAADRTRVRCAHRARARWEILRVGKVVARDAKFSEQSTADAGLLPRAADRTSVRCAHRARARWEILRVGKVVARDGIEPPTPAFSGPRSTTELSGQCGRGNDSDDYKQGRGIGEVSEAGWEPAGLMSIADSFWFEEFDSGILMQESGQGSLPADELLVEG